ncbi:Sporulation related domain-containing protein [Prevotellaceae bacterium HUN156]|nr:Sporulation related domain-containing protein [Prevotellaceae bacterium HUN156]
METKQYQIIKKVLVLLPFCLFTFLPLSLSAQSFTQRIQKQPAAGQGSVTIHQSDSIDQLVNSTVLSVKGTTTKTSSPSSSSTSSPSSHTSQANTTNKTTTTTPQSTTTTTTEETTEQTQKMIRGGHKVVGYRVQAFAGGNSRKDRQQAEQIRNSIKSHYPNVPVYVHFYSPRWICRVGNYRTYEEAHQMLTSLRNLGYTQASIVKGKITVAD